MSRIKRSDLIWAAGLFDGEGCISLSKRSPQRINHAVSYSYVLIVKLAMCHRATIMRIYQMFGVGTLHGQQLQKMYLSKAWIWFCNREDAEIVIRKIRPWLFTKAKEADLALEFFSLPLMEKGGRWGSRPVTPQLEARRNRIYEKLRDCKSQNRSKRRKARQEAQK